MMETDAKTRFGTTYHRNSSTLLQKSIQRLSDPLSWHKSQQQYGYLSVEHMSEVA